MEGSTYIEGKRRSVRLIAENKNVIGKDNTSPRAATVGKTSPRAATVRKTSPRAATVGRTSSRAATVGRTSSRAVRAASPARTSPRAVRVASPARTSPSAVMAATAASPSSPKSLTQPNKILDYRLDVYDYMQGRQEISYYLDIEKLLAKIELDATGIVCLSNPKQEPKENFKFAIKIAVNKIADSTKEIFILEQMIPFIRKGYHNLPLLYQAFKKKASSILLENSYKTTEVKQNIELFVKKNPKYKYYNIYANEYADGGDLKHFLRSYGNHNASITGEIVENAIAQIIMAIATLHELGIKHNDTHHGNFLYHKIQPGGYIKYVIQGTPYYIRNLGYLWVIWDFGISTQLNLNWKYDYFYDYEMLSLYLRKKDKNYNMHFDAKHFNAITKKAEPTKRLHGHLEFEKTMPSSVVGLENTIYEFSKVKQKNGTVLDPAMSFESDKELTHFLTSQDGKKILQAFLPHSIQDSKGKDIKDECSFLREHLFQFLPAIFQKADVSDDDVLFQVNLQFDKIVNVNKKIGDSWVTDYDATIAKYQGSKIFLPEIFK